YAKPCNSQIDELQMPLGYQPPNFQQFDEKGNFKKHAAYFIETCYNSRIYGDSMVKQFVNSLKESWVRACQLSFEELATRAHNLELQIARHRSHFPSESREKKEPKKDVYLGSTPKQKLIKLPTPKHPEEAGQVNDPKYCRYHQIASHPLEKCFILKDLILQLINEKKIILDVNENVTTSNVVMISFGTFDPTPVPRRDSIPRSGRSHIPGLPKDSIPRPRRSPIPGSTKDSIPRLRRFSVPSPTKDSILEPRRSPILGLTKDSIPRPKRSSILGLAKTSIPGPKRSPIQSLAKASIQDPKNKAPIPSQEKALVSIPSKVQIPIPMMYGGKELFSPNTFNSI
ncbi:Cornifin domain-containing protein, partial [Cephalotus follicularis]